MAEDRYYVDDEFVIDRRDGSVKYDDMRGRAGQIVAELLNYVDAMEPSGVRTEGARPRCPHCRCSCAACLLCGEDG